MPYDKVGRNSPCTCGSGIKYKFCCGRTGSIVPLSHSDISEGLYEAFDYKECLAPFAWRHNCSKEISKGHSVSRSGSLKKIASDNQVYSLFAPTKRQFESILNASSEKGRDVGLASIYTKNIKQASTFKGFCSHHDTSIFEPVENNHMFSGSPQQCFLLGYRALAFELLRKKCVPRLLKLQRELEVGKSPLEQLMLRQMSDIFFGAVSEGLKDLEHCKSEHDRFLENREFTKVRAYVIEFENPPPVMCCAGVTLLQDFNGVELQDIGDFSRRMDIIGFNSFFGGQRGAVVFSWLPQSDSTCVPFIKSLEAIPNDEVTSALLRFMFEHCENVHVNPAWWDSLEENKHNALLARFGDSLPLVYKSSTRRSQWPTGMLMADEIVFEPWTIVARRLVHSGPPLP